ncbi:MAG: homoserine O-acetyltransferase [Actinobacteria bacterium]|nr:homoserine O-acetyltransferase [Actinomycetota bacterium]
MTGVGDSWRTDPSHGPSRWRSARPDTFPASGAWRPGDPLGERRFLRTAADRPFVLEGGGQLRDIDLAFETWGELNAAGTNAILLCHALTGDSHACGPAGKGHPTPGWWDAIIGPGRPIDTDRYFVVCANVLGGCQGSTGPSSTRPDGMGRYGSSFPVVSIRDQARLFAKLGASLGVHEWQSVIGGSMGGMIVLELAVMFPDRIRSIIPIATCGAATAQQIAWWSTGRRVIALDPGWRGGDYYDAPNGHGPHAGLALARSVSQITFRTDDVFTDRFGRDLVEPIDGAFEMWQRFEVERYLEYHGNKLVRRFDANSYLLLTKAMDLHDLGRGRGGLAQALRRITSAALVLGVNSDILYPEYQQRELVEGMCNARASYGLIDSPHGHDAFLIEMTQMGTMITDFLSDLGDPLS